MKALLLPALFTFALATASPAQPTTGASSRTTYRDASGRLAGSADTRTGSGSATNTQYRDASGRLTGSSTTSGSSSGSLTGSQRDSSGRLTGSSSGSGKCNAVTNSCQSSCQKCTINLDFGEPGRIPAGGGYSIRKRKKP